MNDVVAGAKRKEHRLRALPVSRASAGLVATGVDDRTHEGVLDVRRRFRLHEEMLARRTAPRELETTPIEAEEPTERLIPALR